MDVRLGQSLITTSTPTSHERVYETWKDERDSWVCPYLQFYPHRQRNRRIDRSVEIGLTQSTAVQQTNESVSEYERVGYIDCS